MGFKLFILCLSFVVVAVTLASPVCKCGSKEKNSVKKYHLKLSKDGKEFDEEVEIDTKNETEMFHVPKTSPKEAAGDMVYDFKKNMVMISLPEAKACFLINSTMDAPRPAELASLLEEYQNKNFVVKDDAPSKELKFKKLGYLEDRSELSEEMADLCKKQSIYQLAEADYADKVPDVDMKQPTAGRNKRAACGWIRICACVEGFYLCHKVTEKCIVICTKEYCKDFYKCL